jgi:UbiD family decarboxylase
VSGQAGYDDLRDFIERVDALGALRRIDGADPHLEIGAITELAAGMPECPALLFDNIKGHAAGFRIFTNAATTVQRAALALNLDPNLRPLETLTAWMRKRAALQPREPEMVSKAAFLENSVAGAGVDLG